MIAVWSHLLAAGACAIMIFWWAPAPTREYHGPPVPEQWPRYEEARFVTTGYCSYRGWECGIHPAIDKGITASGTRVKWGTCAADWTVLPRGTKVIVPGYGKCHVLDTGNMVKGKHLDLWFPTPEDAVSWGRRFQTVYIVR